MEGGGGGWRSGGVEEGGGLGGGWVGAASFTCYDPGRCVVLISPSSARLPPSLPRPRLLHWKPLYVHVHYIHHK